MTRPTAARAAPITAPSYGLIDPARLLGFDKPLLPLPRLEIGPVSINGIAGSLVFVPK